MVSHFLLSLKKIPKQQQNTEALKAPCKSLILFVLGRNRIQTGRIAEDHPIALQIHGSF